MENPGFHHTLPSLQASMCASTFLNIARSAHDSQADSFHPEFSTSDAHQQSPARLDLCLFSQGLRVGGDSFSLTRSGPVLLVAANWSLRTISRLTCLSKAQDAFEVGLQMAFGSSAGSHA